MVIFKKMILLTNNEKKLFKLNPYYNPRTGRKLNPTLKYGLYNQFLKQIKTTNKESGKPTNYVRPIPRRITIQPPPSRIYRHNPIIPAISTQPIRIEPIRQHLPRRTTPPLRPSRIRTSELPINRVRRMVHENIVSPRLLNARRELTRRIVEQQVTTTYPTIQFNWEVNRLPKYIKHIYFKNNHIPVPFCENRDICIRLRRDNNRPNNCYCWYDVRIRTVDEIPALFRTIKVGNIHHSNLYLNIRWIINTYTLIANRNSRSIRL